MGLFENQETRTTATDDLYSGMDDVQLSEQDPQILPGVYPLLFTDSISVFRSKRTFNNIFVATFDILESQVENRPAGTSVSLVINYSKSPEVKMRNIKEFLVTLNDCSPEEMDASAFRLICSDKNPCHGRLIRLEAVLDKSKNGIEFLRKTWRTIPKELQDQSKELRQKAGFAGF